MEGTAAKKGWVLLSFYMLLSIKKAFFLSCFPPHGSRELLGARSSGIISPVLNAFAPFPAGSKMLFPACCARREHFASALVASLGSRGWLFKRDMSLRRAMSLLDSLQATTRSRVDRFPSGLGSQGNFCPL